MHSTSALEGTSREVGLRVTRPRVSGLSAVHALPHADTDSTIRFVRDVDRAWDKVMNLDQPYPR